MGKEGKQGFWSRLLTPKSSCCGELKIEEVAEERAIKPQDASKAAPRRSPCCGGDTNSNSGGCCG